MLDLIIKNGQCYINGELKDADVAIKEGKIQQIGQISDQDNPKSEIVFSKYFISPIFSP